MKLCTALALCALSTPALADVVLTKKIHTDEAQGAQGRKLSGVISDTLPPRWATE